MDIGQKVVSSLKWLAVARLSGQLISWVITIVVIRLLTPSDYGLMAQAMYIIGLLTLINELGMGAALVQRDQIDDRLIGQVFALVLLINLGIFLLLALLSPLIASFFNEPTLVGIVLTLGVGFLFGSFSIVPSALLNREMAFKKRSIVDLAMILASSLTSLALALAGCGVWALVISNVVGMLTRAIGLNIVAGAWPRPVFNFGGTRQLLGFGGTVTASQVLWYLYSQADVIIVGRVLGKELLGFYSVAMQLAALPMQKIGGMLSEVGFAAFSRMQNNQDQFSSKYLKAAETLSFFAFPTFFGLSAVSPELVSVLLGEKWLPAVLPMQLLSLMIPLRMLSSITTPALAAHGRPDVGLKNLILAILVMPSAFLLGTRWGLFGVVAAWIIAYPLVFVIMQYRSLKVLGLSMIGYVQRVIRPLIPSLLMYLIVMLVRSAFEAELSGAWLLVLLIVTGVLAYSSVIFALHPSLVREVLTIVRK